MRKILVIENYGDFDIPVLHTLLESPKGEYNIENLFSEFINRKKASENASSEGFEKAIIKESGISKIHWKVDLNESTNELVSFLIEKGFRKIKTKKIILSD